MIYVLIIFCIVNLNLQVTRNAGYQINVEK